MARQIKRVRRCIICHVGHAEVPDRNTHHKRLAVCRQCHGQRLLGDLRKIVASQAHDRGDEPT